MQRSLGAKQTYTDALQGQGLHGALLRSDCDAVFALHNNTVLMSDGSNEGVHAHPMVNFVQLLAALRRRFPHTPIPDVYLHFSSGDTNWCGNQRPERMCLSSSAAGCSRTLVLPIHDNQVLSPPRLTYFRGLQKKSKQKVPFRQRSMKAVWHGGNVGHLKIQQWFENHLNTLHNRTDANRLKETLRQTLVRIATGSNVVNASFTKTNMDDWFNYQIWLSIDGFSYSGNLPEALLSGSVMMRPNHEVSWQWYEPLMQPYVHFVPVAYNLSDLFQQIHWVHSHQSEASKIAENAAEFAKSILFNTDITACYSILALREVATYQQHFMTEFLRRQIWDRQFDVTKIGGNWKKIVRSYVPPV